MLNPAHPGEIVRECMEEKGWTVTECAANLGVSRITLSRLLNCRAGVSTAMALALERIGWSVGAKKRRLVNERRNWMP